MCRLRASADERAHRGDRGEDEARSRGEDGPPGSGLGDRSRGFGLRLTVVTEAKVTPDSGAKMVGSIRFSPAGSNHRSPCRA